MKLKIPLVKQNYNGKIWCFINLESDGTVVVDTKQHFTPCLTQQQQSNRFHVTLLHVKCNVYDRQMLWLDILDENYY